MNSLLSFGMQRNRIKLFFHFPELLLPIAIILAPVLVGHATIDIMIEDTYFVFGNNTWGLNDFFVPISILLTITWLALVIGRKDHLLSVKWSWLQVGMTLFCLAIIVKIISSDLFQGVGGFAAFNPAAWRKFSWMSSVLNWTLLILVINQLILWIGLTVVAVVKAIAAKNNGQPG
ncbi:hypothetical protein ACX0G9_27045 [Flavitalea flava]